MNRTLVRLLEEKSKDLKENFQIGWKITGIASRRMGWIANASGIRLSAGGSVEPDQPTLPDVRYWLRAAQADVVFEATSLNIENGKPAIDHIRAALESGAHAITANKGPVVFAHRELTAFAARQGKQFLFESTVMDGVPIFSLFARTLPTIHVLSFRGILNSTTNVILTGMEEGLSFEDSLKRAQEIGVAETDASADIEGWDSAVKVAALVNVLIGVPLRPADVQRQGIQDLPAEEVREARRAGFPYKLVCEARRTETAVEASVAPVKIYSGHPFGAVRGTSSIIEFVTDIFPKLTITEENPGLYATAYGMLADFVRAVSGNLAT